MRGQQWEYNLDNLYSSILDIIDTKLYASTTTNIKKRSPKYTLPITFDSKAVELKRISQILNHLDIIENFPSDIQNKENIPMVTYQLGNTVRKNC